MAAAMLVPGEEELGIQRRCTRCLNWWPAADETFWFHHRNGWHPWCRACHADAREERRLRERNRTPVR